MSTVELVEELFRVPDPYPVYRELHEHGPVVRLPGTAVVLGHAEASAVLRDPAFVVEDAGYWDSVAPHWRRHASMRTLGAAMLYANGPRHAVLRAPLQKVFTPARLAGLRPLIEAVASGLAEGLGADTEFMAEYAAPLPITVICELLGVPNEDRAELRPHAVTLATTFEPGWPALDLDAADKAATWLSEYFTGLLADRRRQPGADLVSALAAEDADGPAVANLVVLLFAGFETLANLLGSGLARLAADPVLAERLRDRPDETAAFVTELLRHEAPVQLTSRRSTDHTMVGNVPVSPETAVLVLLAAANRDPRRFAEPDRFDPRREGSQPLTFGLGRHHCLGARLAVLEAEAAFSVLLARFGHLAPAGEPTRHHRFNLRGYATLPVSLR